MHGSDERFRRGSGKGPPGERLGSALRLFARRSESRESRGRAAFADLRRATNATPRASAGPSSAVAGYGHEPRHARGWSRDSFEATVASPGWRRRSRRSSGGPADFPARSVSAADVLAPARRTRGLPAAEARRAIGEILSSAFAALTDEEMASIVTSEDSPAASAAIASACGDDPEAHAASSRAVETLFRAAEKAAREKSEVARRRLVDPGAGIVLALAALAASRDPEASARACRVVANVAAEDSEDPARSEDFPATSSTGTFLTSAAFATHPGLIRGLTTAARRATDPDVDGEHERWRVGPWRGDFVPRPGHARRGSLPPPERSLPPPYAEAWLDVPGSRSGSRPPSPLPLPTTPTGVEPSSRGPSGGDALSRPIPLPPADDGDELVGGEKRLGGDLLGGELLGVPPLDPVDTSSTRPTHVRAASWSFAGAGVPPRSRGSGRGSVGGAREWHSVSAAGRRVSTRDENTPEAESARRDAANHAMDGLAALARRHPACASRIAEDVGFLVAAGATLAGAGRPGPGVVASVGAAARALVACARARPRATDLALRLEDDASESVALDAVDALLRATTAAARSGSGKPSGETLRPEPSADASAFVVDTAVAAAAALEAIASRPLGADVVLAHPDVVPQLLALAAPPHPPGSPPPPPPCVDPRRRVRPRSPTPPRRTRSGPWTPSKRSFARSIARVGEELARRFATRWRRRRGCWRRRRRRRRMTNPETTSPASTGFSRGRRDG